MRTRWDELARREPPPRSQPRARRGREWRGVCEGRVEARLAQASRARAKTRARAPSLDAVLEGDLDAALDAAATQGDADDESAPALVADDLGVRVRVVGEEGDEASAEVEHGLEVCVLDDGRVSIEVMVPLGGRVWLAVVVVLGVGARVGVRVERVEAIEVEVNKGAVGDGDETTRVRGCRCRGR